MNAKWKNISYWINRVLVILYLREDVLYFRYIALNNKLMKWLHRLIDMELVIGNFTTSLGPLKRYTSLALATGCDFSTEYNMR